MLVYNFIFDIGKRQCFLVKFGRVVTEQGAELNTAIRV
jgi:hypothetical protein